MPARLPRTLCFSLRDVAPATLADRARILAFLDDLHLGPVALLVIPDFHGTGRVDRDRRFIAFIESRILRAAGWQPSGFVAPDWLMSGGTCDALEDLPLRYFSTRDAVTPLGSQQRITAPTLTLGAPAAWGRASNWSWMRVLARLRATHPILRIALHPTDQRDPAFQRFWRNLRLRIDDRQVLTEDQLISRVTRRTVRSDSPARELRTGRLA